jgi:hypothetical protein
MLIYKDIFSSDEMASDTYKCKVIDDVILEIECKLITFKPGFMDEALLGANASADGGMEDGGDEDTISGPDLVLAHRLTSVQFDKKGWTVYIKDFMKRTLKYLEENHPEKAAAFKKGAQGAVKKILGSFKDWEMYSGENMDPNGSLAYLNYREDGITPYIWFFLHGLEEEKV